MSAQTDNVLTWKSPGPVVTAFRNSDAFIRGLMGPIGSGKTTACSTIEIAMRAQAQMASPVDGIARTRFAVIRDTYRVLNKNLLPSFKQFMAPLGGKYVGGGNDPVTYTTRFMAGSKVCELEVLFLAIGDQNPEAVLRGLELTGAFIDEADLLAREVYEHLTGRLNRYPGAAHGGATWSGLWMTFNAPDEMNWVVDLFKILGGDLEPGIEFFKQPSGFSPDRENAVNLKPSAEEYYAKAAIGKAKYWVRRMIENEIGFSRDGEPVFKDEFDDDVHVAKEKLEPRPGVPVLIGIDGSTGGLNPAAIFGQIWGEQIVWLREIYEKGCGASRFAGYVNAMLASDFRGLPIARPVACDPAVFTGGDKEGGQRTFAQIVEADIGLPMERACPTNEITPRLEAIRQPLMKRGGFLMCPSMQITRKGMNSMYRYKKTVSGGRATLSEKPDKNEYSNPIDAGGYLNILFLGFDQIVERRAQADMPQSAHIADQNWSVF